MTSPLPRRATATATVTAVTATVAEEEDSNMASNSSGSSPALFTEAEDDEVLQILPTSPSAAGKNLSKKIVKLEPFVHQVGGHFPMACLAQNTVCKPLNEREHKFYKTMCKALEPFVPRYEGTMKVEVHEDDQGYFTLTGQPPPNFSSSRKMSFHHQMLQLHRQESGFHGSRALKRSKSRSNSSTHSKEDDVDDDPLSDGDECDDDQVFCNPWALKCHRDHLKKLGLLSPGPSTPPNLVSDQEAKEEMADSSISVKMISGKKRPQLYLLLENLVSKYRRPCVLDLKVGARQYPDDVSAAKKARKIAKAASTTLSTLGLRLTGMQVYHHENGKYICHNKYYGRSLNQDSFFDTIEEFFKYNIASLEDHVRKHVILRIIRIIEDLESTLTKLDTYRFYTASLLITYDGMLTKDPQVDVRLIDFAHSTHRGFRDEIVHQGPDSGFIQGLKSLLQVLEQILQKHQDDDDDEDELVLQ